MNCSYLLIIHLYTTTVISYKGKQSLENERRIEGRQCMENEGGIEV